MQSGDWITINGQDYQLDTVLLSGNGSYGQVWAATDTAGQPVAIKVINTEAMLQADPALHGHWRAHLEREIAFLSSLDASQSRHVVVLLNHGVIGDQPALVLELLQANLNQWLAWQKREQAPPPDLMQILDWACQILDGLDVVHQAGFIYRDLKPNNLLVGENGALLKLADFGSLKREDGDNTRSFMGTPATMAPEQALPIHCDAQGQCEYAVDYRADYYALGLLLFSLLTEKSTIAAQCRLRQLLDAYGHQGVGHQAAQLGGLEDAEREQLRRSIEFWTVPVCPEQGGAAVELAALIEQLLSRDPADRPAHSAEIRAVLEAASGRSIVPLASASESITALNFAAGIPPRRRLRHAGRRPGGRLARHGRRLALAAGLGLAGMMAWALFKPLDPLTQPDSPSVVPPAAQIQSDPVSPASPSQSPLLPPLLPPLNGFSESAKDSGSPPSAPAPAAPESSAVAQDATQAPDKEDTAPLTPAPATSPTQSTAATDAPPTTPAQEEANVSPTTTEPPPATALTDSAPDDASAPTEAAPSVPSTRSASRVKAPDPSAAGTAATRHHDQARRQAKAEAEAKAEARRQAKAEARAEARRQAQAEAAAQAKAEAEAAAVRKAEREAAASRQAEARRQAKAEAEAQRQAKAEARRQAKAEAEAKAAARRQAKAEAEARRREPTPKTAVALPPIKLESRPRPNPQPSLPPIKLEARSQPKPVAAPVIPPVKLIGRPNSRAQLPATRSNQAPITSRTALGPQRVRTRPVNPVSPVSPVNPIQNSVKRTTATLDTLARRTVGTVGAGVQQGLQTAERVVTQWTGGCNRANGCQIGGAPVERRDRWVNRSGRTVSQRNAPPSDDTGGFAPPPPGRY